MLYPTSTQIIQEELPVLRQMIADEMWYAGERLRRPVTAEEVQSRIILLIQINGARWRREAIERILTGKSLVGITLEDE